MASWVESQAEGQEKELRPAWGCRRKAATAEFAYEQPGKQLALGFSLSERWCVRGCWLGSPGTTLVAHGGQARSWAGSCLLSEEVGGGKREVQCPHLQYPLSGYCPSQGGCEVGAAWENPGSLPVDQTHLGCLVCLLGWLAGGRIARL